MSKLRELQLKDIEKIYEWANDDEVTKNLLIGRYPNSKDKIENFIKTSWVDKKNFHFAIVNDENEYVGTVSLKNINYIDSNAEYAIVIHKDYWGKNYSQSATKQILGYAFKKLNLHKIYLNVVSNNVKANRFYNKFGFKKEATFKQHLFLNGEYVDLDWYYILKADFKGYK